MGRCGEEGLKIGRQGPANFTEHDFYMAKKRASRRTTLTQRIPLPYRKFPGRLHWVGFCAKMFFQPKGDGR